MIAFCMPDIPLVDWKVWLDLIIAEKVNTILLGQIIWCQLDKKKLKTLAINMRI